MGGSCCGNRQAVSQATSTPYEVKLPDGTVMTVQNKAQERVERDKAFQRIREQNRRQGYRIG
jgi:hypothetical protein